MQLTIIAAIVIALLGAVFAVQNNVPVTINFLHWRFDTSLAVVLPLALVLGALIIAMTTTPATLKRQWLVARQKRRIDELEKSAAGLRDRIAELENHLPPQSKAEAPPYVGLKRLILERADESKDKSKAAPN